MSEMALAAGRPVCRSPQRGRPGVGVQSARHVLDRIDPWRLRGDDLTAAECAEPVPPPARVSGQQPQLDADESRGLVARWAQVPRSRSGWSSGEQDGAVVEVAERHERPEAASERADAGCQEEAGGTAQAGRGQQEVLGSATGRPVHCESEDVGQRSRQACSARDAHDYGVGDGCTERGTTRCVMGLDTQSPAEHDTSRVERPGAPPVHDSDCDAKGEACDARGAGL